MVTRYLIKDEKGRVHAVHVRKDVLDEDGQPDKEVWWERVDGSPGLNGNRPDTMPLYGSEILAGLPDGATVVLTEGEKARDALKKRGIPAVGTVCGAGSTPTDERLQPLVRLDVVGWRDNDDAGASHWQNMAQRLHALGAKPRTLHWADAPHAGDAADFTGSDEEILSLIQEAQPWEPSADVHEDGHEEEAGLAELLDDVPAYVSRYVVLTPQQLTAVTLWAAHTHTFKAAAITPYLNVKSGEKQSGKTRLLETLGTVVSKPWYTTRTSVAALVRKVDAEAPTLLLDETDGSFARDKEFSEALRQVLNAGFKANGVAALCVGSGANMVVADFSCFCPKVLGGIGELPDTVQDRSIPIEMARRKRTEHFERFRQRKVEAVARPLRERLAKWGVEAVKALQDAEPALPDDLSDRGQDAWEALLAVADLAGGEWPQKARTAALVLSAGREDLSDGVRLLIDIRDVFDETRQDKLASLALLKALQEREESPWGEYDRGRPLSVIGLAKLLKPYGVRPKQLRFGAGTLKGYERHWFEDAWERYAPIPEKPETSETPETPETPDTKSVSDDVHVSGSNGNTQPLARTRETGNPPIWNQEGYSVSPVSDVSAFSGTHAEEDEVRL